MLLVLCESLAVGELVLLEDVCDILDGGTSGLTLYLFSPVSGCIWNYFFEIKFRTSNFVVKQVLD